MKQIIKGIIIAAFVAIGIAITTLMCVYVKETKAFKRSLNEVQEAAFAVVRAGEYWRQETKRSLDYLMPDEELLSEKDNTRVKKERYRDNMEELTHDVLELHLKDMLPYEMEYHKNTNPLIAWRYYMDILPYMTDSSRKSSEFQARLKQIYLYEKGYDDMLNNYNSKAESFNNLIQTNWYYRFERWMGSFSLFMIYEYPIVKENDYISKVRNDIASMKRIINIK